MTVSVRSSVCSKAGRNKNRWTIGTFILKLQVCRSSLRKYLNVFVEVASNTLEADTEGFIQPQSPRTCLNMFKLLPSLQGCGTNKQTKLSSPEYHLSISYFYPATLNVCQVHY